MTDATRTPTPIDTIADAWVDTLAEQLPTLATYIGRSEDNQLRLLEAEYEHMKTGYFRRHLPGGGAGQ